MSLLNKIKKSWLRCTDIFELTAEISTIGVDFRLVILGQQLTLNLTVPDFLVIENRFCPSLVYGSDNWFNQVGIDYFWTTGFSLIWRAHEYTPTRYANLSILGLNAKFEYLSPLGWDDKEQKYFKINANNEN